MRLSEQDERTGESAAQDVKEEPSQGSRRARYNFSSGSFSGRQGPTSPGPHLSLLGFLRFEWSIEACGLFLGNNNTHNGVPARAFRCPEVNERQVLDEMVAV